MSKAATLCILLGLFLCGGVYSFWRQKMPVSVIALLGVGAAMSLAAGLLRL
jgi:uncharacterized membrane protein (UPF0136 family)